MGRSTDRIAGDLILSGTEHAIAGARITLTPLEPIARDADAGSRGMTAVTSTTELGAFLLTELSSTQQVSPLLRGWAYELRADADGFYSATARVEFAGGELLQRLEIVLIDDELMQGEQIHELPVDAVDNPEGTLIEEVLRRQGREPPPR